MNILIKVYTASVETIKDEDKRLKQQQFVDAFGGIYEHSAWVAEQAFANGPPESLTQEQLCAALRAEVDASGEQAQLILLRAHPDLAGKLAVSGELTAESTAEQASAGIDQCTPEQFARFQTLNTRYVEKFGFPFIMAVKGSDRHQILAAFESRVNNDKDTEFRTALAQVHKIAELRIQTWLQTQGADA